MYGRERADMPETDNWKISHQGEWGAIQLDDLYDA